MNRRSGESRVQADDMGTDPGNRSVPRGLLLYVVFCGVAQSLTDNPIESSGIQ